MKNYFTDEIFNHLLEKAVESAPTWDDALVASMQLAAEHGYHITKELEKKLKGDWEFEQTLKKPLKKTEKADTHICRFCNVTLPKAGDGCPPDFILEGLCPYHFAMVGHALEALLDDGDSVFSVAPAMAAFYKPYSDCDDGEKHLHMLTIFITNAFRGEEEETRKAVDYITSNDGDEKIDAEDKFLRALRDRMERVHDRRFGKV